MPKSHEELAEYIASHIRISSEDMLTLIEGTESGYNLNENLLYAIAAHGKRQKRRSATGSFTFKTAP